MVRASGEQASIRARMDRWRGSTSAAVMAGLRPAMTCEAPRLQTRPVAKGRESRAANPARTCMDSQLRGWAVERPDEREPKGSLSYACSQGPRIIRRRFGRRDGSQGQADRRLQAV